MTLRKRQREFCEVYRVVGGNVTEAAQRVGCSRSTAYRWLNMSEVRLELTGLLADGATLQQDRAAMPRAHPDNVTIAHFENLLERGGLKPSEALRVIEALVKLYDRRAARQRASDDTVQDLLRWTRSVIGKTARKR